MHAAALGALGLLAAACSATKSAGGTPGGDDAGDDGASPTADGGSAGADEDAAVTSTFVRIAQVSPDLPPIDVCVAVHGTGSFQGPLLAPLAAADAGDPGVGYAQVSAYVPLAPGSYDVRLVPAGASSCAALASDAGDLPDTTSLPSLALGLYTTLLVAGDLSPAGSDPGITVAMLPDDAVLAGGAAALRAVNAVPSQPSLDFGLGSAATPWQSLFTGVRFAAASTQSNPEDGPVDANGYLSIAPFADQALAARVPASDAGADLASASAITIPLGSIATVLAIGGKTGDPAHPPALLVCTDNQPSGGLLADCSIAP
jgi:hypothetical protein